MWGEMGRLAGGGECGMEDGVGTDASSVLGEPGCGGAANLPPNLQKKTSNYQGARLFYPSTPPTKKVILT